MKRIYAIVILILLIGIATSKEASAQSIQIELLSTNSVLPLHTQTLTLEIPQADPPVIEPVQHIVQAGESLSIIANIHGTTWLRLWQKNTQLIHQDKLEVGSTLQIPAVDEVLSDRQLVIPSKPEKAVRTAVNASYAKVAYNADGNTYSYGYCTWYAKSKRPDLPNSLGNANTWYSRATAMGLPTGNIPRAGAVGATTAGSLGHVVYIERVNGDGTVYVSEMNYEGWGVVSYRTTSADEFLYLY